jgi:phage baseplate assembly protein W
MIDYGTDLSCTSDLSPALVTVSGRRIILEACVRRLMTPLGSLRRHPQYGYDVRDELNDDLGPGDLARIGAAVAVQLLRDTRLVAVTCRATLDRAGALTIDCTLTDGVGPFRGVFAVSDATVAILEGG